MGIIYKLTSPSNKVYIGQTTVSLSQRLRRHKHDAIAAKRTTAIARAIRKYGYESFDIDIILNCDNEDLNDHEIRLIQEYNSTDPKHGYNISTGGQEGYNLTEEARNKISNSLRDHYKNNLPKYIRKTSNSNSGDYGYEIRNHPKCKRKIFTSRTQDDEKTLQRAMEYLTLLDDPNFHVEKKERDLPKGVCYDAKKQAYIAYLKIKDKPRLKRSFGKPTMTLDQKKQLAINQLSTWKTEFKLI